MPRAGVVTPLDREQARAVLELVGERGFEAVAVCLLWAVANPAPRGRRLPR